MKYPLGIQTFAELREQNYLYVDKTAIIYGMNNLNDISMDQRFATLCGVTQQELESNFAEGIDELSALHRLDKAQLLVKIKHRYNGYYFEENAISVYNPFSLLSLFIKQKFNNFWYTTATPTFLLNLLQDKQFKSCCYGRVRVSQFSE